MPFMQWTRAARGYSMKACLSLLGHCKLECPSVHKGYGKLSVDSSVLFSSFEEKR
jgi:hypothetical protein